MMSFWRSLKVTVTRVCAIYARQSIDKSDSISIETQIERCMVEVGNAPYSVYSDRGYSGKNTDRPQFQKMLAAVTAGEIRCVICYKLDRCSRSILDFTQLMNVFLQYEVEFISCTEKFDTSTPMGRAMLNICVVFAQLERETIQQRITDAYHSRCIKGYFMGGHVPFGFSLIPCLVEGKKSSCYSVVHEEAEILKQIYDIYQEPSASLADIVLTMKSLDIKNPRRSDGQWIRPHIYRMIKNPVYVKADGAIYDYFLQHDAIPDNPREDFVGQNGCYLYRINNEQHLVIAPHEGIIPPDIWLRCQKHRSGKERCNRKETPGSWLNGKLTCMKCGGSVCIRQSIGKNKRLYRYFVCASSRGRAASCEGFKPFPVEKTEIAIRDSVIRHVCAQAEGPNNCTPDFNSAKFLREMMQRVSGEQLDNSIPVEKLKRIIAEISDAAGLDRRTQGYVRAKWGRLAACIVRFDEVSHKDKSRIAQLLIRSAQLTEGKIVIHWRI